MENPMIPTISISKPPILTPTKQETLSEFLHQPTKKHSISYTKRAGSKITETHLNLLSRSGRLGEAITVLDAIAQSGSKVRSKTFLSLLDSCIDSGSVEFGGKLHARVHLVEDIDPFVETKLVSMYAKCGSLSDARKVFEAMRERNLYTWSAMIGACSREQRWDEVVELFFSMMKDGVLPDTFLFPKILQACSNCEDVVAGKVIHSLVIRLGMIRHPHISNSILAVYAKCGKLISARRFFQSMGERDSVAWNAMISGLCQEGDYDEARRFFGAMQEDGIDPGLVTWNILISSYNQRGQCDVAMGLMTEMESSRIIPDVFTWTSMISGLAQNGREVKALNFFKGMLLAGIQPNDVTLASAISACASLRALNMGLEVHSFAMKIGLVDDILVGNSLVDMYCKCGEVEAAKRAFDLMKERDIYTWNSLIAGYCQVGYCGKAYELLKKMKESDVKPTVITWNAMMSGYIQNGDEDEAVDIFERMQKDGTIRRDTASWNSLIAGYAQLGKKDKALGLFRKMQSDSVSPNSVTVLSVVLACANLVAAKKIKEIHACVLRRNLDSALPVPNALIDTYAKSGNIVYARTIFDGMSTRDVITWNSMMGGYVLHGHGDVVLDLFSQMKRLGLNPNRGSFASIILALSIAGMVDEGKQLFSSIKEDYHIKPAIEHYSAMVDLYGRSRRLREALRFIEDMPTERGSPVWAALLTASRVHGSIGLAALALEHLLDLEPENILVQQLMLRMFSLCAKLGYTLKMRNLVKENTVRRSHGQSWVEVKNVVHTFVTGDQCKPCSQLLYSWAQGIASEAEMHDDHNMVFVEEEELEEYVGIHSEKLALAFSLLVSPSPSCIRVVKNIRMCKDCHRTAKYISMTHGCEIYLSDTECLHHFKNGWCSCGDYW